jgi:CheY-like chemotaxis protein
MGTTERTILVVEDDEETLNVFCRTLAASGHDVIWARNGADALKLLTRTDRPIALIIADVVLPGMPARELVEEVSRSHPGVGVIYVSAYPEDAIRSHGVDPDTMPFLPKPYEPEDLQRMVAEALGTG